MWSGVRQGRLVPPFLFIFVSEMIIGIAPSASENGSVDVFSNANLVDLEHLNDTMFLSGNP